MAKDKDFDKNFVPAKPTKVITATHGNVTVVSKLYGEVSDARYQKERALTHHRAEQLDV